MRNIDLNAQEEGVIIRMMDFCEENWSAFTDRCEEAGLDAAQVDLIMEGLRTTITE